MSSPEFKAAQNYTIHFGKYKGKTINEISCTDEGLLYLDWLRGQGWIISHLAAHLKAFLEDPTVKRDLENLL